MAERDETINGYTVKTNEEVTIIVGPVVGEVTSTFAIGMIEVERLQMSAQSIELQAHVYEDGEVKKPLQKIPLYALPRRPQAFLIQDLKPDTGYTVVIHGVCGQSAKARQMTFKTKKENPTRMRMYVVSSDRANRPLLGQTDPWRHMYKHRREEDDVELVLHIGDQIHPDGDDITQSDHLFSSIYDECGEDDQRKMQLRARELYRRKYRAAWSRHGKADLMASVSNLTIWSDNDVASDFTRKKDANGKQSYHPMFLQSGMRTYREYQRRLWNFSCSLTVPEGDEVSEWHGHSYGGIGVWMFDLRGSRIDCSGKQMTDHQLLSDWQWSDLMTFFANPDLRVAVLCSEQPFVSDSPKAIATMIEENPELEELKDHWSGNPNEFQRLLDLCFAWKSRSKHDGIGRDVLLVGGGMCCGATSVIADSQTGQELQHLTTSPVTSDVDQFPFSLSGRINDRYTFSHEVLGENFRNYADIAIDISCNKAEVFAELVPISARVIGDTSGIEPQDWEESTFDSLAETFGK